VTNQIIMTQNIFFIVWIILGCFSSNAQELVSKFPLKKKGYVIDVNYAHFIPKSDKNAMQLFVIDDFDIGAVELDDSLNALTTISTEQRRKEFLDFSGGYADKKMTYLYFTGRNDEKFNVGIFDFANKTFQLLPVNLKLKGEVKLGTFTFNNSFLLLTIIKKTSVLKLYTINGDKITASRQFDLQKHQAEFEPSNSLYDYLTTGFYNNTINIQSISTESPSSLESTSSAIKLYQKDDKAIMTIDRERTKTIIIELPLADATFSFKVFPKVTYPCVFNGEFLTVGRITNSLIYKDRFFQVFGCKSQLGIRMYDYKSGQILKAYNVYPDKEIAFSNSALKQEGGNNIFTIGKNKEIENVNTFLKKVETLNCAIAAYQYGEKLELTIGGYEEIKTGPPVIGFGFPSGGTSSASYGIGTGFYSPMLFDYYNYAISKQVSFKSILNANTLEHIKDTVAANPFDIIKKFSDEVKKEPYKGFTIPIKYETIFKINDSNYYYGYLRNYTDYYIYRFKEEN
jgi:hypothetical protein